MAPLRRVALRRLALRRGPQPAVASRLADATPARPGTAPPVRQLSIAEPPTELMERYATEILPDPS
ncbi:hypothetical protein GCM10010519_31510 [Streptomyces lactacystinicus]